MAGARHEGGGASTDDSRARFCEPPWDAPLDAERECAAIPATSTVSGMFLMPLLQEAKLRGYVLPSARSRYVPFSFYPTTEHVALMLETCAERFSRMPLRQALRRLGHGAAAALSETTFGKVTIGAMSAPGDVVGAMAKAYTVNVRPSSGIVLETGPAHCVVRLERVPYFLDSHHVGVFEGVLGFAKVKGRVLIDSRGPHEADLLVTWAS